jgi:hypothetical protein
MVAIAKRGVGRGNTLAGGLDEHLVSAAPTSHDSLCHSRTPTDPHGNKLFVNLSASQTRRRLKGFGHGVRKVQSAGRNQAVIVHTATGQHREELETKFADVGYSRFEGDLGEPVENLPNLGPTSAAWLCEAGIATVSELQRLGPVLAYRIVNQREPKANLNLLWALAAALAGKDWRELSDEEKVALLAEAEVE